MNLIGPSQFQRFKVQVSSPQISFPVPNSGDKPATKVSLSAFTSHQTRVLHTWFSISVIATAITVFSALLRPESSTTLGLILIPYCVSVLASARIIMLLSKRVGTPNLGFLNPYAVLVGIICTMYVARPLHVLRAGVVGSSGTSTEPLRGIESEVAVGVAYSAIAITMLCFGLAAGALWPTASRKTRLVVNRLHPSTSVRVALLAILAAALLAMFLQTILGSERGFFGALTARQLTFKAQMHLLWATEYLRLTVFAFIGARRSLGNKVGMGLVAIYFATLCLDFLSGSRTELLLNNLFLLVAIAVVTSTSGNRLQQRHVMRLVGAIAALLFFVGFVALRQYVRDERGTLDAAAVASSIVRLDEYILDSDEAAGFDYFLQIQNEYPKTYPYRGWDGIASILSAPVPSAVFPSKPDRASVTLTGVLAPARVKHNANIAVSGFSDLYSIGGLPSIVFGAAAVGTILGLCMQATIRFDDPFIRVIISYVVALSIMDAIRSDVFAATLTPARLILVWLALRTALKIHRRDAN